MSEGILSTSISAQDALISTKSIELLRSLIFEKEHSLVFFVGAGASIAGNTGMPSTPSLLYHLLSQSISSLGSVDFEEEVLSATLAQIAVILVSKLR